MLLKPNSFVSLIQQNAYVIILAIGMVMVIIATHIDLSVGSLVAFIGGVCAPVSDTHLSPLYRTAAWGMADGTPDFLNAVVELGTTMGSHELLAALDVYKSQHPGHEHSCTDRLHEPVELWLGHLSLIHI